MSPETGKREEGGTSEVVFVTGGAGYIASHTARLLAPGDHELVVLDNLDTGHEWAVRWGPAWEWANRQS